MCNHLPPIPTNFDEYTASLKEHKPEDIKKQTLVELASFIEKQIKVESNQTLLIVGRKAGLLFQPFLSRLIDKGYSPTLIRRLNGAFWTKGIVSKHVSLLADCINTGEEILYVVKNMLGTGHFVDKIYCYASNGNTITELKKDETFAKIPLLIEHILNSTESQDFFKRIQVYYQSLLDPIDSDHAYDIYHIGVSLNSRYIQKVVGAACQKVLGKKNFEFQEDQGLYLPKNVKSFSLDLSDIRSDCTKLSAKAQDFVDLLDFYYPFIRLKICSEIDYTRFSIMSCFPIESIGHGMIKANKNGC